jgi:hypothetical protein
MSASSPRGYSVRERRTNEDGAGRSGLTFLPNIPLLSFDFLDTIGATDQSECGSQDRSHRQLAHTKQLHFVQTKDSQLGD